MAPIWTPLIFESIAANADSGTRASAQDAGRAVSVSFPNSRRERSIPRLLRHVEATWRGRCYLKAVGEADDARRQGKRGVCRRAGSGLGAEGQLAPSPYCCCEPRLFAPFCWRYRTTDSYFNALAASSAVRPSVFAALTSTPCSTISVTASSINRSRSPRSGWTHGVP